MRDNYLYGVPETKTRRGYNQIRETKPGDILVFYVISPVRGIVGIYEIVSEVFEDRRYFPWEDRLYPYRVRIRPLSEELKKLPTPIPLKVIKGKLSKIKSSRSFMGQSIVELTKEDFNLIKSLIKKLYP